MCVYIRYYNILLLHVACVAKSGSRGNVRLILPLGLRLLSIATGEVHRVMSLRNPLQKMSKSDNQELSRINLSDSPDEIRKKIRRAVTDSDSRTTYNPTDRPGVSNLVAIYSAMTGRSTDDICSALEGRQTVDLKDELSEVLIEKLSPIREEITRLDNDRGYVDHVLRDSAKRAGQIAQENINEVKHLLGIM